MTDSSISDTSWYISNPPAQPGKMEISTINYRKTIFEHPHLSKIVGIPTYETLNLLHRNNISNAMAVHSSLGGGQHG